MCGHKPGEVGNFAATGDACVHALPEEHLGVYVFTSSEPVRQEVWKGLFNKQTARIVWNLCAQAVAPVLT